MPIAEAQSLVKTAFLDLTSVEGVEMRTAAIGPLTPASIHSLSEDHKWLKGLYYCQYPPLESCMQ